MGCVLTELVLFLFICTGQSRQSSRQQHSPHEGDDTANNDEADEGGDDDDGEGPDFTTCMFCSKHDRHWNEDALDLHYWRDCPLLFPCQACAQVTAPLLFVPTTRYVRTPTRPIACAVGRRDCGSAGTPPC